MSRARFMASISGAFGARKYPPAAQKVFAKVSISHGVSAQELTGRDRRAHIVAARRDAARQLRTCGMSRPRIGEILGGRDSTTVRNLLGEKRRK